MDENIDLDEYNFRDISGYINGYFYIKFSIIKNYSKFKQIFNLHIIIILKLEGMIISISF